MLSRQRSTTEPVSPMRGPPRRTRITQQPRPLMPSTTQAGRSKTLDWRLWTPSTPVLFPTGWLDRRAHCPIEEASDNSHPLFLFRLGFVPGGGEHVAQVEDGIRVDVLVGRDVEEPGLGSDGDCDLAIAVLLDRADRLQQGHDGAPLDVMSRRVSK